MSTEKPEPRRSELPKAASDINNEEPETSLVESDPPIIITGSSIPHFTESEPGITVESETETGSDEEQALTQLPYSSTYHSISIVEYGDGANTYKEKKHKRKHQKTDIVAATIEWWDMRDPGALDLPKGSTTIGPFTDYTIKVTFLTKD